MNNPDEGGHSDVTSMLIALLGLTGIVEVVWAQGADGAGRVIGIGVGVLLLLFAAVDAGSVVFSKRGSAAAGSGFARFRTSWVGKTAVFVAALFAYSVLFAAAGFVPAVFVAACIIRAAVSPASTLIRVVAVGLVVSGLAVLLFRVIPGSMVPLLSFGG